MRVRWRTLEGGTKTKTCQESSDVCLNSRNICGTGRDILKKDLENLVDEAEKKKCEESPMKWRSESEGKLVTYLNRLFSGL